MDERSTSVAAAIGQAQPLYRVLGPAAGSAAAGGGSAPGDSIYNRLEQHHGDAGLGAGVTAGAPPTYAVLVPSGGAVGMTGDAGAEHRYSTLNDAGAAIESNPQYSAVGSSA